MNREMPANRHSISDLQEGEWVLIKLEHWGEVRIALVGKLKTDNGCSLHGDSMTDTRLFTNYKPNSGSFGSSYYLDIDTIPQVLERFGESEKRHDCIYSNGLKAGWNMGLNEDTDKFQAAMKNHGRL